MRAGRRGHAGQWALPGEIWKRAAAGCTEGLAETVALRPGAGMAARGRGKVPLTDPGSGAFSPSRPGNTAGGRRLSGKARGGPQSREGKQRAAEGARFTVTTGAPSQNPWAWPWSCRGPAGEAALFAPPAPLALLGRETRAARLPRSHCSSGSCGQKWSFPPLFYVKIHPACFRV